MALRNRIPDDRAIYPPPVFGVNLNVALAHVQRGESPKMQNCIFRDGTVIRLGSTRITSTALQASKRIRGGHMFYYSTNSSKRMVAYGTRISTITDAGAETQLTTGMTDDQDTHFLTWPITDKVYAVNGTDEIQEYDGTTFQAVSAVGGATNVPGNGGNAAASMMAPVLDRVLAITENGVERSDPRVAHIWSSNSSWATLRPSQAGPMTAIYPFSTRDTSGSFLQGAIAFQANAHYLITGTDFGDDVTAASASSGEDASMLIVDPNVGTSSPYSIVPVPGLGLFWFTSDANVFWLPYGGQIPGRMVGDRIRSVTDIVGIEGVTFGSIGQVWGTLYDRFLRFGIPVSGQTYASTEWWLDLKEFVTNPNRPIWYGPMTGRTVGRCWTELQTGDNAIVGGEGNPSTGAFLYKLDVTSTYNDAVGTSDNAIDYSYQTYFKTFGNAGKEKYFRSIEIDANQYSGSATLDIEDLEGGETTGIAIESVT